MQVDSNGRANYLSIALLFKSAVIFSMAYRNAFRGILAFLPIT
jgi:hypothetical protein